MGYARRSGGSAARPKTAAPAASASTAPEASATKGKAQKAKGKDGKTVDPWRMLFVCVCCDIDLRCSLSEIAKLEKQLLGDKPSACWRKIVGEQIENLLSGYVYTESILAMGRIFPDMLAGLSKDELAALKADAE